LSGQARPHTQSYEKARAYRESNLSFPASVHNANNIFFALVPVLHSHSLRKTLAFTLIALLRVFFIALSQVLHILIM